MQRKINILISTAVIALLGLISIQGYLIYNTYELKKDAFLNETRKTIGRIDDESEVIAEVEDMMSEYFMQLLWEYKYENLKKEQLKKLMIAYRDSIDTEYNSRYQRELKKANLGYDIKFKKDLATVILLDSIANDTVFAFDEGSYERFIGQDFEENEAYSVSRAFIQSDYINELDSLRRPIDFRVVTYDRMNISEWQAIVLGRMALLFIGSLLVVLFVVGLFYYSIRNLIKQKKVTDVKTDFINNITHELKTPLATLGIITKSLRKKEIVTAPKALENTLGILDRQHKRLHKLIDQVTNNSLGSEDLIVHKESVLVSTYFNNIISDFALSMQEKNIQIEQEIESGEVYLPIDTFLCTTALLNILENAVKYGKDHIHIKVRVKSDENQCQICIKDNGIGIAAHQQKLIFDKFYRITMGNVHDVKGLGLGLYYTKQVIDAHQGNIRLESKPGMGTTFKINLPLN